jgi:hypothetical protein
MRSWLAIEKAVAEGIVDATADGARVPRHASSACSRARRAAVVVGEAR